ncbi:MAG: hypothetical protein RBS78_00990 [Coriobacteriia bacterium]|jgi:hypothetical protein|nr:hypothetical protein [Coriobacteriia bacterium]
MPLHSGMTHAEVHEPKHITLTLTSDAGKVITPSSTVAGTSELRNLVKSEVGLGNVDNTSDADKPVSTAQQNAINARLSAAQRSAINALTVIATTDAIDPGTTQTLVNECKAKINDLINALNAV